MKASKSSQDCHMGKNITQVEVRNNGSDGPNPFECMGGDDEDVTFTEFSEPKE